MAALAFFGLRFFRKHCFLKRISNFQDQHLHNVTEERALKVKTDAPNMLNK